MANLSGGSPGRIDLPVLGVDRTDCRSVARNYALVNAVGGFVGSFGVADRAEAFDGADDRWRSSAPSLQADSARRLRAAAEAPSSPPASKSSELGSGMGVNS